MLNYVYIATSLDGFIATSDGGLDWLNEIPNPEKSDYGFAGYMDSIDALLMGRNTFEKVLSFGEWSYSKPVFVLSNSLIELPERMTGKAEIVKGDIKEIIADLNSKGYNNLYIDGDRLIRSCLKEDLVDELIITRVPILLGEGIPLFGEMKQSLKFKHAKTETFTNGLVKSSYLRKREGN